MQKDDVIYRQAAIEVMRKAKDKSEAHRMLVQLPSALPTCTVFVPVDDCISRQAAVELIERMKPYHQDADDIAEMIANMPPAQPGWTKDVNDILAYLDGVVHSLVSPENWNVYSELHDMVSGLLKPWEGDEK